MNIVIAACLAAIIGLVLINSEGRQRLSRQRSGVERMIGARVIALTALAPEGRVNYAGENWAAILEVPGTRIEAGSTVRITAIEGLRVRVQPVFPVMRDME